MTEREAPGAPVPRPIPAERHIVKLAHSSTWACAAGQTVGLYADAECTTPRPHAVLTHDEVAQLAALALAEKRAWYASRPPSDCDRWGCDGDHARQTHDPITGNLVGDDEW